MEVRNQTQPPGTNHGNVSVVLRNTLPEELKNTLRSGPLSPEQLADILDEPHTRRAWFLDLHTSADLFTGTTISDLQDAVDRSKGSNKTATHTGSNGQPAVAPVSISSLTCSDLVMPVCECSQPVSSIRPFDWQCAKCKGVIPSPASMRDYVEAL
jgi:hypothetical protein